MRLLNIFRKQPVETVTNDNGAYLIRGGNGNGFLYSSNGTLLATYKRFRDGFRGAERKGLNILYHSA